MKFRFMRPGKRQRGSSLLEVTVALSILLVSMMSSLQTMLFWGTQSRTVGHLTQVEQLLETAVEDVKALSFNTLIDGLHGVDPNNGSSPAYPIVIMYPTTAYQVTGKPYYPKQMVFYDARVNLTTVADNVALQRQQSPLTPGTRPPVANTAVAVTVGGTTYNVPAQDFTPTMAAINNLDYTPDQMPVIQLRGVDTNSVWVYISGRYYPSPTGTGATAGGPSTVIATVSIRSMWTTNAEVVGIGQLVTTIVRTG